MAVKPREKRSPPKEERLQIRRVGGEMSCSQTDRLKKSGSQT